MKELSLLLFFSLSQILYAENLGETWGTEAEESRYYRIVNIPVPRHIKLEAVGLHAMPDNRLAVGTRRGDIYLVTGAFDKKPEPRYHLYASGLDEIFGMDYRDDTFYVSQQSEITRITDTDKDGRADHFETLNDDWGFENYHEFSFGSKLDKEGCIWLVLGLTKSYYSEALFRGWCLKITPAGKSVPIASGIRSAGGVGENEHGVMFYTESQGPWNGSCSLKHLKPGGFMGHPVSYRWYPDAKNMGPAPVEPNTPSRLEIERERIKELTPYAVVFPYKRMGRSISGFMVDKSGGKFGPFENQIFVADYSMSFVMRATTELVNGVWQGACYPFREGLSTGLMSLQFSAQGQLFAGGTSRGWPVRGSRPYSLERLDWTGKIPFEIKKLKIMPDGFLISFTEPVNALLAEDPEIYSLRTFTHIYRKNYGSPEVDQTQLETVKAVVSKDRLQVRITLNKLVKGHVHEFDLSRMRSQKNRKLVHPNAYYTVNEIPNP